jgi:hypothetical protein
MFIYKKMKNMKMKFPAQAALVAPLLKWISHPSPRHQECPPPPYAIERRDISGGACRLYSKAFSAGNCQHEPVEYEIKEGAGI